MNQPLYRIVYEKLLDRIRSGEYPPQSMLPSEPEAAKEFGVSLITLRRAIHELVLDGLIDSRQGIGNVVVDGGSNVATVRMMSFVGDVASGRLRIVRTLMEDSMVQITTDIAKRLGAQPGSLARKLVRLDCHGGAPLSLDEAYIPPVLASVITPEMAASPLFTQQWQEALGTAFVNWEAEITVEPPTDRDQAMLSIGPDIPILVTGELMRDPSDRAKFWVVTRYRSDRCRLSCSGTLAGDDAGDEL